MLAKLLEVPYAPPSVEGLWDFCREREAIRLRKEAGQPPPWTENIILRKFHFCNIHREHDRGTRWYMGTVVPAAENFDDLLWRTILYRAVNNSAWFLRSGVGVFGIKDWSLYNTEIRRNVAQASKPYSPAYITLQGPDGLDRKTHLLELLEAMARRFGAGFAREIRGAESLKQVWENLQTLPYVGPFIALQVYRDLLLADALPAFSDDDFVYLGPGCRKGVEMLLGIKPYKQQYVALQKLQQQVPEDLWPISLGDLEQTLCEARKYWRLQQGGGRHRYYMATDHRLSGGAQAADRAGGEVS